MKKRLAVLLCALVLLAGALLPSATAAWDDGLIFLAVNIRLLPLASYMPITVNGSVYVPASVFDASTNGGTSLGIYSNGPTNNIFNLYDRNSQFLTFDLTTGNSYDFFPNGEQKNSRAVMRNGKIYVSVAAVCDYFDLDYTYRASTPYGYPMVRIKSKDSALPGMDEFVNAASSSAMLNVLNEYYKTLTQSTTAPAIPSPTPSSSGTVAGDDDHSDVAFRLALSMETGEAGVAMLDTLRADGRTALLLFPPQQLAAQDDLVRRAVGEGHSIGLLVPGGSAEEARAAIDEGNDLLSHIARIRTRMILPDGADQTVVKSLEGDGYLCWSGNISGVPGERTGYTTAREVMREAGNKKSVALVTMDDSSASANALSAILRIVRTEKYNYRSVLETDF